MYERGDPTPAVPAGGGAATTSGAGGGGAPSAAPAAGGGGGAGAAVVAAMQAVKDTCTIVPMDLISPLVPGAPAPITQPIPPTCTITNQKQVVEVTLGPFDTGTDALDPAVEVSGLGVKAWLQKQQPDDAYVKVVLTTDGGSVYVEVAGHDGKDHGDDAVAIAKAVIAKLGG